MTVGRAAILLVALAVIALAVVYVRSEQTRCAANTLALESKMVQQRRDLWRLQVAVARLQAPSRVRERVDWFRAELIPPGTDEPLNSTMSLASSKDLE
ncbi:MAG: hypothetical protein JSU63_05815 [Phycisphaerales bacterium]|nr:MAG: hypothetical protein JSU63_05815 [Phycisphaerales bacterium]